MAIAYLRPGAMQDCNATEVDLATDADVAVSSSPCALLGVFVNDVCSAHEVNLLDGTTTKIVLPVSMAAGSNMNLYGARFDTSLTVNTDDAATGKIVLLWVQL